MATIKPNLGDSVRLSLVLGQQFVSDSVSDPAVSGPDELFRSGGKLMFFGSEATGLSAYARVRNGWGDVVKGRLGAYSLYERGTYEQDDVWLVMADVQVNPLYATHIGAHLWTLRDRSGGATRASSASGRPPPWPSSKAPPASTCAPRARPSPPW
jgi:hypothetical protein